MHVRRITELREKLYTHTQLKATTCSIPFSQRMQASDYSPGRCHEVLHVTLVGDISQDELPLLTSQKLATGPLPANPCSLQFAPTHSGGLTYSTERHPSYQGLTPLGPRCLCPPTSSSWTLLFLLQKILNPPSWGSPPTLSHGIGF